MLFSHTVCVAGFAAGFADSGGQSLLCMPDASQLPVVRESTIAVDPSYNVAALTPARYNLQNIPDALFPGNDNQPVKCVLCYASRRELVSNASFY